MGNKKYWGFLELILLLIIILSISIFYLNQNWIGLIYNSDILFIPEMYNDLIHGGHYKDLGIATTGMFFPDWLIYSIAYVLTKKIYFQFLIIACVNTFLLYVMIRLIYNQYFKRSEAFIFTISSIVIFLFLAIKTIEPFVFLMVLGQHMGGFIIGLFYIYLYLISSKKRDYKKSKNILVLMIGISFLMGASDILFIAQFLIPILAANIFLYLYRKVRLKNILWFSLVPCVAASLGFLLLNKIIINSQIWSLISSSEIKKNSFNSIHQNFNFFLATWQSFNHYYIITSMYVLFYLVVFFNFISLFLKKKYLDRNNIINFISLFIFFTILLNILFFCLFENTPAIRHLEPFFYFPILTFFIISILFNNKKILNIFKIFSIMIVILCLLFLVAQYKKIFSVQKEFYPYEVSCIDQALQSDDNYGVANYWTARPINMFTKKNLHVTEVFNNLLPFSYGTNLKKISSKNSFSYVILNVKPLLEMPNAIELRESDIISFNGKPKKKIICGSKKLLIYKKGSFKIPVFNVNGDSFFWPGSLLPSQFNILNQSNERYVARSYGQGFVSFGPYIPLLPGKYLVYIYYKSNLSTSKKIGFWDITYDLGKKSINNDLFGTDNKYRTVSKIFEVSKKHKNSLYEFRLYTNGTCDVSLKGIKLSKIKK